MSPATSKADQSSLSARLEGCRLERAREMLKWPVGGAFVMMGNDYYLHFPAIHAAIHALMFNTRVDDVHAAKIGSFL